MLTTERLARLPFLVRYAISIALVGLATVVTSGLWLLVERAVTSPLYLAAISLAAYYFGMRAGVFASVVAGLAIDLFFVEPYYDFSGSRDEVVRLFLFVVEGSFLSLLIDRIKLAADELRNSREELLQLTQYQQTLREAEQKRIALEIHDELGQALTGLKLDIHLLKRQAETVRPGAETISSGLEGLSSRVDSTIGTVRRIASELRPSVLDDFGLVAALEWQASQFRSNTGIKCKFRAGADDLGLEKEADSGVFRIAQEALTNIARHAKASKVEIDIYRTNGFAILRIADDGQGFDTSALAKKRSLGLLGMRERARLMNGDLKIESDGELGTVVELTVPLATGDQINRGGEA